MGFRVQGLGFRLHLVFVAPIFHHVRLLLAPHVPFVVEPAPPRAPRDLLELARAQKPNLVAVVQGPRQLAGASVHFGGFQAACLATALVPTA